MSSSVSARRIVEARKLPPSMEAQPELVDNLCERCISHFCDIKASQEERHASIKSGCTRSTPEAKCQRCREARHDCKEPPHEFRRANNVLAHLRRTAIHHAKRGNPEHQVERDFTEVIEYATKYLESRRSWSMKLKGAIKEAGGDVAFRRARRASREVNLERFKLNLGLQGAMNAANIRVDPEVEDRVFQDMDSGFDERGLDPARDKSLDEHEGWRDLRLYWFGCGAN